MSEERTVCELCGAECSADESEYFNDQLLCGDCLDEHSLVCTCCGARIWADDNCGDSDHPLCESCYDSEYTRCESCSRLIRRDEANYSDCDSGPYCDSCYDDEEHAIHVLTRIASNQNTLSRITEKANDVTSIESQWTWVQALSNTASGNLRGKEKIMLETYIQMTYFDRVITRANTRFMGRFLEQDVEKNDSRKRIKAALGVLFRFHLASFN